MKVFLKSEPSRRAYKRPYKDGRPPKFRAFPPATSLQPEEEAFETEEELAYFLQRNPIWKPVVKTPGKQDGHVNTGIIIEGKIDLAKLR